MSEAKPLHFRVVFFDSRARFFWPHSPGDIVISVFHIKHSFGQIIVAKGALLTIGHFEKVTAWLLWCIHHIEIDFYILKLSDFI